ncbi:DUF1877 family protein [Streptomyces sp. MC1]|uniref:DUF1877 family protein n=1 Tax=Streptomyces sp. MC1 TaxID=295105 RepID=UPI0035A975DF
MSMIGEYVRLTAAELERTIQDPDWALEFAEGLRAAEEERGRGAPLQHLQDVGHAPLPAGARRVPRQRDLR